MSIKCAMNLIRDVKRYPGLRKELNTMEPRELETYLEHTGYKFTPYEFEETVNMLHVKCQTEDEADELMQIKMWFRFLFTSIN